jgi:cell division protein FtsQ
MVLVAWLLVISGMATLLIAANRKQKDHVCHAVLIGIKGGDQKSYVGREAVLKLIEKTANGSLLHRSLTSIDLEQLEKRLNTDPWIKNAELYFDSKDALHVFVEEREPMARVFTTAGSSFYIDSSGHRMPLLEQMSIRVPLVTGFTNARRFNAQDSVLLNQVKQVAGFISGNEFWNAQIGQIDITPEREFELFPVIGNHIIKLGAGDNVEEKLDRLYVFYKQVMSKEGFDKYAALDIRFNGQVIGVKKGATSAVDSIQLRKNIEELMNRANLQNIDEEMLPQQNSAATTDSTVSNTATRANPVPVKTNPTPIVLDHTRSNTANRKTTTQSNPPVKTKQNDNPKAMKPKAVMPKRNEYR